MKSIKTVVSCLVLLMIAVMLTLSGCGDTGGSGASEDNNESITENSGSKIDVLFFTEPG